MQERGRREPRHQRRVLDRVPRVVAAPADLLVRPVRAEQLADAERRPRDERPAPRRDEPALVGAAREQRADRERERHREADVAEVEQRRVREHVRVLEARRHARRRRGRGLRREGARDDDDEEREEDRDRREHRHDPHDEVARPAPVEPGPPPRRSRSGRAARGGATPPARPRTPRSCTRSAAPRSSCCATYVNEKSLRRSAASSTADATSVEANAATSAFCAECASRRRPSARPRRRRDERVERTGRG